jgi:hypothetical protein
MSEREIPRDSQTRCEVDSPTNKILPEYQARAAEKTIRLRWESLGRNEQTLTLQILISVWIALATN